MKAMTKKPYVKADITLVDFSLSSGIASSCAGDVRANIAVSSCTYIAGNGDIYFASDACKIFPIDSPDICYDVPTDDTRVFAS